MSLALAPFAAQRIRANEVNALAAARVRVAQRREQEALAAMLGAEEAALRARRASRGLTLRTEALARQEARSKGLPRHRVDVTA